ncbi:hypothetical protein CQY20_10745 [Mycolicibacterium agri]|uniref:3-keto-disaccharide hydrolase domain-containing protein n=1 Tax=Mycolicibacterium agri TaxID=36811 RepID=A0A2A7N655_MYCAG|nr:hypothetical protein [Mycolicibacterium agri]PEG39356.1 hypothetical protein CQY20_10745 [Mycolicibacterium agri]GFG51740.1 hypothetical protein MAGR_31810 [Mycolicibacterium agri]
MALCRVAASVAVACLAASGCTTATAAPARIAETFIGPDGLIAAEGKPAEDDTNWEVTSGSLFRTAGTGWTGHPDAGDFPGATGSAVFRMVSRNRGFDDLEMSVTLRVDALVESPRTPAQDYDGAHLWVRYRSDRELYAISVDRRDATMIIKKKCPGGDSNGGTYYDLSPSRPDAPIPQGQWQHVTVTVADLPDGTVHIAAVRDGIPVEAIDSGVGCPALHGDGGVGIRGDNAEIRLASVIVDQV